jgi:hypothetical protein
LLFVKTLQKKNFILSVVVCGTTSRLSQLEEGDRPYVSTAERDEVYKLEFLPEVLGRTSL